MFFELLSTKKLLKFKICKNEKAIINNLKNVKKEKRTSLIFMRNMLMKIIFTEISFLSCEKEVRRRSVRYKIQKEILCHITVGTNKVRKVHIFGVGFEESHLFGIASIAGIENPRFYT